MKFESFKADIGNKEKNLVFLIYDHGGVFMFMFNILRNLNCELFISILNVHP